MYSTSIVLTFVILLVDSLLQAKAQCPAKFRPPEGSCLHGCLFDSDCDSGEICCTYGCYASCVKLTKCQSERRRIQMRSGSAAFIPHCDDQGNYMESQCAHKHFSIICWKVDKHGHKIPNSEITVRTGMLQLQRLPLSDQGGSRKRNTYVSGSTHISAVAPTYSKCFKKRGRRLKLKKRNPNVFVPKCKQSGKFKRTQCNRSSSKCWCVNPTTGRKIKDSEERNGRKPNCRQGCGRKLNRKRRIVGGTVSHRGEWPWQAALFLNGTQHRCGGALIKPSWVVTAAHCFSDYSSKNPADWQVRLGEHSFLTVDKSEIHLDVLEVLVHPKYVAANVTHPGDYDIALVRLNTSVRLRKQINAICLPDSLSYFQPGQRCVIAGWGKTSWNGNTSPVLREAWIDLVSRKVCNAKESYNGKISKRFLCAGFKEGGTDACAYDSGGPLMCPLSDGRWVLAGIISWGEKCALPYKYGVYSNVHEFMPWISRKLRLDR